MNLDTVRNAMIKRAATFQRWTAPQLLQDNAWKTYENPTTHKTGEGQTVDWMAEQYGTTRKAILDLNPGLVPEKLQIGQVVNIPKWTERRRIWETNHIDPEDVYPLEQEQMDRQREVETHGLPNQVNPRTNATGPLQFRQSAVDEVNKQRKLQRLQPYTLQDMQDWEKAQDAAQTLNWIWGRQHQYSTGERWLGDHYARKHNTGNNWQNNDRGLVYLKKMYSDETSDATGYERVPGGIAGAPEK